MHIIDPTNPAEGDDQTQDPASAAAGAQDTPTPEPTAEEREAAEIAAVDKALEEPENEQQPAAKNPDGDGDETGQAAADGKPADAGKQPADKAGDDDKPKPDADIEREITERNLQGKSAERFRELATEVKGFAPVKAELEKAGIKSVEDVAGLLQRGQAADSMIAMVMETGATEEQYGTTLDYLTVLNRAQGGDREAAEQAFAMISREYAELAKALGKEVPGVHDPLAEHPDLQKEVESADLSRERALEIASQRRQAALAQQAQQRTSQQTEHSRAQQQALQEGADSLRTWEADKLADQAYLEIRPQLSDEVAKIKQKLPPNAWATATEYAYQALMAARVQPVQQQARRPAPSAMRPGVGGTNLAPKKFASDMDAVDAALESM
jgi:hypothetical protein